MRKLGLLLCITLSIALLGCGKADDNVTNTPIPTVEVTKAPTETLAPQETAAPTQAASEDTTGKEEVPGCIIFRKRWLQN